MDVVNIVDTMASFGLIRTNKVSGEWYQCYCPIHNGGNEKKPSFGILLKDKYQNGQRYPAGFGHCFTCQIAKPLPDLITEILRQRNMSGTGLQWLQDNVPGFKPPEDIEHLIPTDTMQSISAQYAVQYITSKLNNKPKYVSEEELQGYRYTVPYMYERKLTDEIIEKFDVGYDGNWKPDGRKNPTPCITFPVRDINGNTLFICRRSIEGKIYNYPKDVTKPVYGLDMLTKDIKSVVVCESIINALTCWTWGYPAIALLGTGNAYQINQLRKLGIRDYVLCMDGDEAGHKATKKLKKALREFSVVWVINMPDGKDVNDCTKEEFIELYNNKE